MTIPISIRPVRTNEEVGQVIKLVKNHEAWIRERYPENDELITQYYKEECVYEILSNALSYFVPPEKVLLIATAGAEAAGTISFKQLDEKLCEMNRLFVSSHFRGKGVGRSLCNELRN
ncbi:MAG: GNAT family N-acetyltransferase [Chloroflexota bacterium]